MKKFIIVLAVIVGGFFCLNPYSNYVIKNGFTEKDADKCMSGAAIKRRIGSHMPAASVYKKIQENFPEYENLAECHYYLAYCYEKADKSEMAMAEYASFVAAYPENQFTALAKKRLSNLEVNSLE